MTALTNIALIGFTSTEIKQLLGSLDPKNENDKILIKKLLYLSRFIKKIKRCKKE